MHHATQQPFFSTLASTLLLTACVLGGMSIAGLTLKKLMGLKCILNTSAGIRGQSVVSKAQMLTYLLSG